MIKPEMVPDNVEEHFLWCAANTDMTTRECIAAALNAWPGMRVDDTFRWLSDVAIILPMEDKNAES